MLVNRDRSRSDSAEDPRSVLHAAATAAAKRDTETLRFYPMFLQLFNVHCLPVQFELGQFRTIFPYYALVICAWTLLKNLHCTVARTGAWAH